VRPFLPFMLFAAGLIVAARPAPVSAKGYPEPSIYPISWELDFKHGDPKRVVVGTTPYWYVTYTVTNNSGAEQNFIPDFQMLTNDGKVVKSDRNIPIEAFDKIKSREGARLLQPASQIGGPLRQGPDQAKDGVAIWQEPTARMGSFKIFVGGLSGEYAILKDDQGQPVMDADKLPVMLHKTFEVDYSIYGDEFYPGRDDVHELKHSWIMR
jgi:hypothetical protein